MKLSFPSQQGDYTGHRYHKKSVDLGKAWAKHKQLLDEEVERRKDWQPGYQPLNETAINNYHENELYERD